ncbi:DEAD/DEAH box helicase [Paenisporosarcina sp. TG20]|uniref:DEAD/DEAH box helicase n=1 Tax=Paenisporosarcina sp. TG20 TaxID=1211706 RepID=UPI0002FF31B4|nr:DEAD/DEAH box helicase [Paenisporosarcina sp. TG20]
MKLKDIYPIAIETTKQKVIKDVEQYYEKKELQPNFETYISDRIAYIEQIWLDVWINIASRDVKKDEKKNFLKALGIDISGETQKRVNKMFLKEIKHHHPFNVLNWLKQSFTDFQQDWEQRYIKARQKNLEQTEFLKLGENRSKVQEKLIQFSTHFFQQNFFLIYVNVRNHIAQMITNDLQVRPKYQYLELHLLEERLEKTGLFVSTDYLKITEFFEELTGDIHSHVTWGRKHYEYETYYYRYKRLVFEFILNLISKIIIENLNDEVQLEYWKAFKEQLTVKQLNEILTNKLTDLSDACFTELQEEYLADLLQLMNTPFNAVLHQKIFEQDKVNRERRKDEELANQLRKIEEEERIIDDIFGKAYTPTLGRSMKYVLHIGETNSGKTHQALQKLKKAESGLYLAPLRLLAFEIYDKLNAVGIPCSLKTGEEEKLKKDARHVSSTVEMFHEKDYYEVIVIDESQMIADKDRGFSWYQAIMKANAKEVHIIGSRNIKLMLYELLGESDIELHEYRRETPLKVEPIEFSLKNTRKGDAIVCFSRKRVLETASFLQRNGHSVSVIYGSMPPETRKKQIDRFNEGETSVVVSTDAIGMGLNLPIQRIVFLENEKFDGTRRRRLKSQEVKQIAGRAGRKGIFEEGKVAFTSDIKSMQQLLEQVDEPVQIFAIAPTAAVFEHFQKYYRHMGYFFELWKKFTPPKGTKKASLSQEFQLYELIQNTEIETHFSLLDLYGFLHLPFSGKETGLVHQWFNTLEAIAESKELPEPFIKTRNLEELEFSYKAIGLHLLFLYRLNRRTEAIYWERVRAEISDGVHEYLKSEVTDYQKTCKKCGKNMSNKSRFLTCDSCYHKSRNTLKYPNGSKN